MRIVKKENDCTIEMGREDALHIIVPASKERIIAHLRIARNGKLTIAGIASFIESISGIGMKEKIIP